jgi:hypothetical protein
VSIALSLLLWPSFEHPQALPSLEADGVPKKQGSGDARDYLQIVLLLTFVREELIQSPIKRDKLPTDVRH